MPTTPTKIAVLSVAAAATLAGGSAATADDRPRAASVTGSAEFRLTFSPDTDVRSFAFDARAVPYSAPKPGVPDGLPTDAVGTVKVSHHSPTEGWTVRFEAKVDCLVTSPGNAALTAVVTRADEPVKDRLGTRVGFSVQDGGKRDRAGFSWSVVNGDQNEQGEWQMGRPGTCMAPAAFAPVTKGGYKVVHVDLPTGG